MCLEPCAVDADGFGQRLQLPRIAGIDVLVEERGEQLFLREVLDVLTELDDGPFQPPAE